MQIDDLDLVELEEGSYYNITVHIVDVKKKEIVASLEVESCEYTTEIETDNKSALDVAYDDDRGEIRIVLPKNHVPYVED